MHEKIDTVWKDEWGKCPTHITNKSFNRGKHQGFVAGFTVGFAVCLLLACLVFAQ